MLTAKLKNASTLQKVIKALIDIVKDANFQCTESGIVLQAMDGAHVAIVLLALQQEGFAKYKCEQNITIGLALKDVLDVLKCANNDDSVTMNYNDEEGSQVKFEFSASESKRGQVSEYTLTTLELEEESLAVPDMEYATSITMSSSEFQRICRDLKIWGEHVTITSKKDGSVEFFVAGDRAKGRICLTNDEAADEEGGIVIDVKEEVEGSFGLNYLNFFTKATPLSGTVKIGLSDSVPLSVEYSMGDLGKINYHLAPSAKDSD